MNLSQSLIFCNTLLTVASNHSHRDCRREAVYKDSIWTAGGTDTLPDSLDDILGSIIEHQDSPTISSNPEGISVCGLPRIVENNSRTTEDVTKSVSNRLETSWTPTKMKIRSLLQVSKIPVDQIDRIQTIFHLGLDSSSAIKVSSKLGREGTRLGANDTMKHKSIAHLADVFKHGDKASTEKYIMLTRSWLTV